MCDKSEFLFLRFYMLILNLGKDSGCDKLGFALLGRIKSEVFCTNLFRGWLFSDLANKRVNEAVNTKFRNFFFSLLL